MGSNTGSVVAPAHTEPVAQAGGLPWVHNDGGRRAAGYTNTTDAGDCVVRAIAIATGQPYQQVYNQLAALAASKGGKRSARDGLPRKVYEGYLHNLGWVWVPTCTVGASARVHLAPGELPGGRIICRVSKHLCAVTDGVVHDNHDPCRGGTRMVYGYYRAPGSKQG